MTLKTHLILSYHTPAPGATPILFHLKSVEAISLQKSEIYFNQKKMMNMSALLMRFLNLHVQYVNICALNYQEVYKKK